MNRKLVAGVVLAILLGAALGWFYRRWTQPTPEERTHQAAEDLKSAVEKMTR